ncbi:MAG: hypothetical protein ABI479_11585 [Gallionella sp.]
MKTAIVLIFLALIISGCGKKEDPREVQKKLMLIPGYREAKVICTQCHALPFTDQHVADAWPSVIARMENYMRANNRRVPTEQEHAAIIGYFQSKPN